MQAFGISRETEDKLRHYESLLIKWQEKINLISPSTVKDAWNRHFLDSLQLLPLIPTGTKTLYDLGSGAGFSGMVLAIACPDLQVTLIESDSKKCAFLQTVSRETSTHVDIQNERIEKITSSIPSPDVVTARALASLPLLLEWVYPWAQKNSSMVAIFPKGERAEEEIEEAQNDDWLFHVKQTPSVTGPQASILTLTDIRKN